MPQTPILFRLPSTSPASQNPQPPVLLDLGARAAEWLGERALAGLRVLTVEPPVGDPARRVDLPASVRCVRALPDRLPFRDGSFAGVIVAGVFEHTRDDLDGLDEMARVLQPGGVLLLRTPRAGMLTWLDPFNLYRYAAETSRRGPLPIESGELGWRRHYRRDELSALLRERGLIPVASGGAGVGLAEVAVLGTMLLCRIVLGSERAEASMRRILQPFVRAESNLPTGRFGYDLVIRAEKSTASSPEGSPPSTLP